MNINAYSVGTYHDEANRVGGYQSAVVLGQVEAEHALLTADDALTAQILFARLTRPDLQVERFTAVTSNNGQSIINQKKV